MLSLIASTLATSAADSINPIGISQQFVLQGMCRKPHHIWYFIISIAITNYTVGMLAYFGMLEPISYWFGQMVTRYAQWINGIELVMGIGFLVATIKIIQKARSKGSQERQGIEEDGAATYEEKQLQNKFKSVTPYSLTVLGVLATLSELTTALPYFAFLVILFNYELTVLEVMAVLLLYNIIYSLPLIIMYFVYVKAQARFDQFYEWAKRKMSKASVLLGPLVCGAIGCVLMFHSLSLWCN